MKQNIIATIAMVALCLGIALGAEQPVKGATSANITGAFANPPLKYHTTPLYWLNGTISNGVIDFQLSIRSGTTWITISSPTRAMTASTPGFG